MNVCVEATMNECVCVITGMTEVLQECLKATGMYHRGCHRSASTGDVSQGCVSDCVIQGGHGDM
jgi:hypothetical protein